MSEGGGLENPEGLVLEAERLFLRRWKWSDRAPFAAMNSDPAVMEHFPSCASPAESDDMVDRIEAEFGERGFGLWALERRDHGEFIGFMGLHQVPFQAPFTPAVEVGWRMRQSSWGQGFATEAARCALGFAFKERALQEVVSFTIPANLRSQGVMQRIGMRRVVQGDFEHPNLLANERCCRHVLYRITRHEWLSNSGL